MSKQKEIERLSGICERQSEEIQKLRDELEAATSWKIDLELAQEKFEKDLRTVTARFIEKLSEIVPQ